MSQVSVYVSDINDAIAYYESVFGFRAPQEDRSDDCTRLTLVGGMDMALQVILMAQNSDVRIANRTSQGRWISRQFWDDYYAFSAFGVVFDHLPTEKGGKQNVQFRDAYGVHWQLTDKH